MKDHYSNVKIPKDCRLGKCDTCRQLAAENLTCKTPEERAALDIKSAIIINYTAVNVRVTNKTDFEL